MHLLLVVGLKGGVGKTTVATGIARSLAREGDQVGILDLDYRTPNVLEAFKAPSDLLDHSYENNTLIPPTVDGVKLFSMSYIWPEGKSVQVSDEAAMEDVLHLLESDVLAWGELDYLVIDTPPTSTGVVQVALEARNVIGALVVSHASTFSKSDTLRTFDLFREKGVPLFGLVANQVGMHDLDESHMEDLARAFNLPFFIAIPHLRQPDELEVYFDRIIRAVKEVTPIRLELPDYEGEAWEKLQSLTRLLTKK